ncbi:hypothetical protein EJB05_50867, partial [Eragrostis curvula]
MAISRCSSSTPRTSPIEVYAECDSIRQSHGLLLLAGTSEVDRDVSLGSDLVRLPGYGRLHRIEVSHGTALVTAVSWDGDCPCAESSTSFWETQVSEKIILLSRLAGFRLLTDSNASTNPVRVLAEGDV